MPQPLRLALTAGIVAAAGWWALADTVRHYRSQATDADTIRFAHFGTYQDYQTWGRVIAAFER